MAIPVNPGDIISLIKFAESVRSACASAPKEFQQAKEKVTMLKYQVSEVRLAMNKKVIAEEQQGRQLKQILGFCRRGFKDIERVVQKYNGGSGSNKGGAVEMSLIDKLKWVKGDKSELDDILSHLDWVVTRFDAFIEKLDPACQTVGAMESECEKKDKVEGGMAKPTTGGEKDEEKQHRAELSETLRKNWQKQPEKESKSDGTILECWTILRATALVGTKYTLEKEKRGQWKLREMAKDFERSTKKIGKDDKRITMLLQTKSKAETDSRYHWCFLAARIESHGDVGGLVATEEIMAIVKRDLTPAAKAETWCWSGSACYRSSCPYKHPSNCWSGNKCTKPMCNHRHPSTCWTPGSCKTPDCRYTHLTLCRSGNKCKTKDCRFAHRALPFCWSGSDCKTSGCPYTHIRINCKYRPCNSQSCTFNHFPGQVKIQKT